MTTEDNRRRRPRLPVKQLVILVLCRVSEPLALTSVYPYLPSMMEDLGIKTDDVALYAGLVSAVFSVCQALSGVGWGVLSDIYGRKTALIGGMTGLLLGTLLFGFSSSVAWAMVSRAIAGLSCGNVGISRTIVAELVPQKELQPTAFRIMPAVWTMGSIFGPGLGGTLARPASTMPSLFGNSAFFKRFPYALPNFVVGACFLCGIVVAFLFLQETLESRKDSRDHGLVLGQWLVGLFRGKPQPPVTSKPNDEETQPLLAGNRDGEPSISTASTAQPQTASAPRSKPGKLEPKPNGSTDAPSWSEIFTAQSSLNLAVYSFLALQATGFDQLLPVFMHHPIERRPHHPEPHLPFRFTRGFGMTSERIGVFFTINAVFCLIAQIFLFPVLARRLGVLNCLRMSLVIAPLVYMLTPFTVLAESKSVREALVISVLLARSVAVVFAFPCSTVLLTNSASSTRVLGTLNGVATSFSALGRAAGPSIGGWLFSRAVTAGYVIIPWWTLAAFSVAGGIPVLWLKELDSLGGGNSAESGTRTGESSACSESAPAGDHTPASAGGMRSGAP